MDHALAVTARTSHATIEQFRDEIGLNEIRARTHDDLDADARRSGTTAPAGHRDGRDRPARRPTWGRRRRQVPGGAIVAGVEFTVQPLAAGRAPAAADGGHRTGSITKPGPAVRGAAWW
jgi:hypothetical protein